MLHIYFYFETYSRYSRIKIVIILDGPDIISHHQENAQICVNNVCSKVSSPKCPWSKVSVILQMFLRDENKDLKTSLPKSSWVTAFKLQDSLCSEQNSTWFIFTCLCTCLILQIILSVIFKTTDMNNTMPWLSYLCLCPDLTNYNLDTCHWCKPFVMNLSVCLTKDLYEYCFNMNPLCPAYSNHLNIDSYRTYNALWTRFCYLQLDYRKFILVIPITASQILYLALNSWH